MDKEILQACDESDSELELRQLVQKHSNKPCQLANVHHFATHILSTPDWISTD